MWAAAWFSYHVYILLQLTSASSKSYNDHTAMKHVNQQMRCRQLHTLLKQVVQMPTRHCMADVAGTLPDRSPTPL
jgi:hypothetical protein